MPWDHCDVEFILDDEACPTCGATKAAWTVELDRTRHLRIGRKPPRAAWERLRARAGEPVRLEVAPVRVPDGERRRLRIYAAGASPDAPTPLAEVEGAALGGRLEATWTTGLAPSPTPGLRFEVDLDGDVVSTADDALLVVTGALEVQVVDREGRPRAGVRVEADLPGGARDVATTDAEGRARWDDLPPGAGAVRVVAPPPLPPPERDRAAAGPLVDPRPLLATAATARLEVAADERAARLSPFDGDARDRSRVRLLNHTDEALRVQVVLRRVAGPALERDAVVQHEVIVEPQALAWVATLRRRGLPAGSEHEVRLLVTPFSAAAPPLAASLRLRPDARELPLRLLDRAWVEAEATAAQVALPRPGPPAPPRLVDVDLYAFRRDETAPHDVHLVVRDPPPAPPPPLGPSGLDVLACNLFLRPTTLFRDGQAQRVDLLAERLGAGLAGEAGHDALVLSELFDDEVREALLARLKPRYPHQTRVVGSDGLLTQDGGVVIVSRWPFAGEPRAIVYRDGRGADRLATKGAIHARLVKGERTVWNLIGTHAQSGSEEGDERVRRGQLAQLEEQLLRAIPRDQVTLVAGDLNVHLEAPEFQRTLALLGAAAPTLVGTLDRTFDPWRNDLATDDMGAREYLDHALWVKGPRFPRRFTQAVRPLRASRRWEAQGAGAPRWDLSDHFAVHARFELPRA